MTDSELTSELKDKIERAAALLQRVESDYSPAALANSFGAEDMVLMDLVCGHAPGITIFTLDTGRLNEETYDLNQRTRDHYGVQIETYFPDARQVEAYVQENGINAFYQSVELRKACCHMRKVEPLKRALADKRAWITGLRRGQSVTREDLAEQEYDDGNGLEKFNPLAHWSRDDVWRYIRAFEVPYNALHDQGYPSIGCAPCTRPVTVGEDERAGRWWWEQPENKECGIHLSRTG